MTAGKRLTFVLLSQVLLIGFLIYNYVVFFETDKIVLGFVGVLTAVFAIGATLVKLLPSNSVTLLQDYAYFLFKKINIFFWLTAVVWLLSVGWTYMRSNDLIGRLVYVKSLQDSMSNGTFDLVSFPNPDVLAKAFSQFPGRREVPFLLERSARLLYQAGRPDIFRAFQRSFLERVDVPKVVDMLCEEKTSHIRHDSLSFLLSITAEAYPQPPDDQEANKLKATKQLLEKYIDLHDRVAKCHESSLEAQFQLIKFEDEINDLEADAGNSNPNRYDIKLALANLEKQLSGSNHQRILEFWQSHGAQEYLDFLAYRLITQINEEKSPNPDQVASQTTDVIRLYERLLLLRQRALKAGEVQWSAPPQKLTLFYAFMLDANLRTLVWADMADLFEANPAIKNVLNEFTNRKIFEEFRSPRGWFAGTPLDFNLNGSAAVEKVNAWLKTDW